MQGSEALRGPSVGLKVAVGPGLLYYSLAAEHRGRGTSGPQLIGRPKNWRNLHRVAGYNEVPHSAQSTRTGWHEDAEATCSEKLRKQRIGALIDVGKH